MMKFMDSLVILPLFATVCGALGHNGTKDLRDKALEMFDFAYSSYMQHAFPADELMPLTCQGRFRGNRPSRGDVDDSLGNFTLTLVDTLDTLAILGRYEEFEEGIRLVLLHTHFDTDVVVSVFETNIRMLGGLLGGHVAAIDLKSQGKCCGWYNNELLDKALEIGERLLPAFNTSSGIPYPKVNLRTGMRNLKMRDTCTACAGSMVLEFAALSRLTGDARFEEAAHKAMDFLWDQRNVHSNLMGTVINVHNGDWVRRESSIGAGIDSYYEYVLKAYILLGDEVYLTRFNKHYDAIMTYISQGHLMLSVDMHKPTSGSRNIMDALLAFWPGLQVLKGDLKSAIEMHEVLYQITQRHNFLPEAVTADFHVHWGQHPLRPEFVESTYFLYKATGDPHYRDVGRTVLENLEKHARVKCGFAAIKDVRGGTHEDQMDSFVLAETFKYLYLLFEEEENLSIDLSQYIFTTEAHILPLSLANHSAGNRPQEDSLTGGNSKSSRIHHDHSCPNIREITSMSLIRYAQTVRSPLKNFVELKCPKPKASRTPRLRAAEFSATDNKHTETLLSMGVELHYTTDGRLQLTHTPTKAESTALAEEGLAFMKEMLELAQNQPDSPADPRIIQILTNDHTDDTIKLDAGPAQFGWDFVKFPSAPHPEKLITGHGYIAKGSRANPTQACNLAQLRDPESLVGRYCIVRRGSCTFVEKARVCEQAGAVGVIVLDNQADSSGENSQFFQMSGDGTSDVTIPVIFLFSSEANQLIKAMNADPDVKIFMGKSSLPADRELVGDNRLEVAYPRSFITRIDSILSLYVEEREFSISASVQNMIPKDKGLLLTDTVNVEILDDKLSITIAPARLIDFTDTVLPNKGILYEVMLDLLVKYTNQCMRIIPNPNTVIPHITSLIGYVYNTYSNRDKPTQRDTELTLELIRTLHQCLQAEDIEEDSDTQNVVTDLDTPHVGELPQFYTQPAIPQASIHHQQTDQLEQASQQTHQSNSHNNIGQNIKPEIPQPDIISKVSSSQSNSDPANRDNLNIEPQVPTPDMAEYLDDSETIQHIESIAPDNERAGNYEKYSESSHSQPAEEVTENSADEPSSQQGKSADIKIAKSRVVRSGSKGEDEL